MNILRRLEHAERWLAVGLVLLALLIGLGLLREFGLDDAFITYRYARNVARGWGLVYNQGEAVLSTTAPLYALLLAALSLPLPDLPLLGGLVGAVSIGRGGAGLAALLPRRMPCALRAWAGLAYTLAAPLWLALGMETPLWMLLVLLAFWLARGSRWGWAGLLIGLGALARPDASLPGALLGLGALGAALNSRQTRRRWWSPAVGYALAAATPILFFYGWAWLAYGSPVPATLAAKRAQAALGITGLGVGADMWGGLALVVEGLLAQSPLYLLFAVLLLAGLWRGLDAVTLLAVAWGGLHLAGYAALRVAPYRWYYAPLLPGVILLAAHGLERVRGAGGWRGPLAAALALLALAAPLASLAAITAWMGRPHDVDDVGAMLPVVDWQAYRETGLWLRDHTPPEATVGVAEVGQIGFYAERRMTDYLGLLQPEVAAALARGDVYSWLPAYLPDYLTFQRFRGIPLVLYNYRLDDDPWFLASYAPVAEFDDLRYAYGPVTIFQRVVPGRAVRGQDAAADFGPLRLVGLGTDGRDLAGAGEPVRVRLDWEVVGALPPRLHLAVTALDVPGRAAFDGEYETAGWAGRFSTWHTFVLPEGLPPRGYPLLVSVAPAGGEDYASHAVGWLDVSFPRAGAPPADAPTFCQGGAALFRLAGQAVEISGDRIVVRLAWYAAQDIPADFTYFLHLRPAGEGVPVAQADGQPLDGMYPTHLWEAGEAVPLTLTLDGLPDTPGAYDLVVGWYTAPDGPRLALDSGGDSLPLARLRRGEGGALRLEP